MSQEKIKVSEEEYARRKKLGLPVTKTLRYMKARAGGYDEVPVSDYEIVEELQPSGTYVLEVTLESGERKNVLSSYFAEMQKPSFVEDMEKSSKTY